jgi:hypothetical protein
MARIFESIEEWEVYVPGIDGGRERELLADDPDNALSMEIRFLSKSEKDAYARMARRVEKAKIPGRSEEEHIRRLFLEHVRNVRNYTFNGVPVLDGEAIWNASDSDLCADVVMALMDRSSLDKGLRKKLLSPSATSTSRQRTNADGGAPGVTGASVEASKATRNPGTPSYSATMTSRGGSGTVTGT